MNGRAEYIHAFRPPPLKESVARYDYVVYALVPSSGGTEVRTAIGAFQVHRAIATVDTAAVSVKQKRGSLIVDLPVVIAEPGNYTFYADLWGENDTPIAFALEPATERKPGRHVIELLFGGNIIRDRGIDGPYAIRNVRIRNIANESFPEADPVPLLATTPAWKAASFGD